MLLPQERIPWILRRLAFRRDVLFRAPSASLPRSPYCEADTAKPILRSPYCEADTAKPILRSPYCEADTAKPILHTPSVYLTFDDGPIPESTPWLLEVLREYGAKATFFMVADNARRYPDLFRAVAAEGHAIGNHTFHHRPPFRQTVEELLADVRLADETLWVGGFPTAPCRPGARLFRPPHGLMTRSQQAALAAEGYRIVMFDLNTLDYRADRTPAQILSSVKRNVRPGSIINLHDSLKSIAKLKQCLPEILAFLRSQGYALKALTSW